MSYTKHLKGAELKAALQAAHDARTVLVCVNLTHGLMEARRAQCRALAEADIIYAAARKRERKAERNQINAAKMALGLGLWPLE